MSTLSLSAMSNVSTGTQQYLPEPATDGYGVFREAMGLASDIGEVALGAVGAASGASIGGDFQSLLNLQMQAFEEMQMLTMVSNIERSKHDTKMAAIRNIRA